MIPSLSYAALWLSSSTEISVLVKATLLLIVALLAMRFARTARASARHLVIATAFAALIALPILVVSVPGTAIQVPVERAQLHASGTIAPSVPDNAVASLAAAAESAGRRIGVGELLRLFWIAGTILFLIPVASALWRLSMIRRTGLPMTWHRAELSKLAAARGVTLPVELLEHEAAAGPMTFGISRPVIVLPLDAREWSEAELRCALMHELEHIQRGDWLMQIMARIVAAGYWFHPLVWAAWRRLCLEAERSCDDAVVASEERTEYAEQLVTLAQRMAATPVQPMLGMANRSDLSTRVTAVLDDRLHRGRAGFALAAGTIAAAAVMVLTVAPVRAVAKIDPAPIVAADPAVLTPGQDTQDWRREVEKREVEKRKAAGPRKNRAIDRALYEAAEEGDVDGVKEMIDAGANPSAVIEGDGSPLIGAARSGRFEITKLLIDHGADPNGIVEGDGSPLIAAAAHGRLDQVQLLVQRGADVNLEVKGDENALMNAAEGGHLAIVKFLVESGANIHTRIPNHRYDGGEEWRTAISQARKNGHMAVVQYLQSQGARE